MKRLPVRLLIPAVVFFVSPALHAQFTTGDVVTLQVGNGVQTLSNLGNSLFLKEFSPTGSPGISVTIPDNGASALIASGAATSEGQITNSATGNAIIIGGYNTSVPYITPIASSASTSVPRAIGQVNGFGTFTMAASSTTFFNGNNIRSATSNGGTNYWASGANSGTCYFGTGTPAAVSTTVTNQRVVQIINGNLMFSTGSGTQGIYQITGTPTSGSSIATILVPDPGGSPYGFAMNTAATVLYLADDRAFTTTASQAGGIQKFTWNGSAWVFQYTLQCGSGTFGARGLAVDFSGANPVLYATTTETSSNRLIKIIDTGAGSGASALVLSTSPANTAYRGVVFSPCAPGSIASVSSNSAVCDGATLNLNVSTLGSPAFSYSWAGPNSFTSSAQNPVIANASTAATGIYTVTITNACGTASQTTSVTINPSPSASLVSSTNVACNGGSNGSATVTASGGNPGYSYAWSPSGGNSASAASLTAASYSCVITDTQGCTDTVAVTITQPAVLSASILFTTNVSCFGSSDGASSVTVSGGTTSYSYSWTPSGGNAATASSLTAGNYTCTVTDANSCIASVSVAITQPAALSLSSTQSNLSCSGGSNGSATITPAGGSPGYTYSWAPAGGNGATASSLAAGSYTCTVTDANGCTGTSSVTLTAPPALTTSIASQTNVSCSTGSDGSVTIAAGGGTPGYSYSWSPSGGNGATESSLAAGSYTCTVTDANGCSSAQSVTITQPSALNVSLASQTNVSCGGGNNGSATVTAAGGTPGYTYSWAPAGGNGATASSLGVGNYTCTITDANSCSATVTVAITQPSSLASSLSSQTNVSCFGGSNGSATVTAAGGSPGYLYAWTPAGGSSATASSLTQGSYTCTVTDANGCSVTSSVTITEPAALAATPVSTDVSCNGGSNGSASVTAAGGTPGYTYAWMPAGGNNATASSLAQGSYICTVTDANGCTTAATVVITEPSALTASASSTDVSCNGGNDGTAAASAGGGTPGYTYSWAPAGGNNATATALAQGSYTCTITDANGCSITASVVITEPAGMTTSVSSTGVSCNGGNDGSATVTASGGSPGYTYSWAPAGGNNATAPSLAQGNYTCTITDANGCSTTVSVSVTEPSAITASVSSTGVSCNGGNDGTATLNASGGTPGYTYSWTPAGGNNATASSLAQGNYTCTVTDANGCTATQSVSVTQPALLSVSTAASAGCGATGGAATASVSGGTGPYTYAWSPAGGNAAAASGLGAGSYTCTVTDNNGCTQTSSVSVTTNPAPTATISAPVTIPVGTSTTLTAGGGNSYNWNPSTGLSCTNCPGPTASPSLTTTYCVLVSDANGCSDTACTTVTVDDACAEIFVPNAFSPNGDNQNDRLCVYGKQCIETFYFRIYDRWGELVFETTDPDQCWDGTYKGQPMGSAVFAYYLEIKTFAGQNVSKKGNITLVR